MHVIILLPIKPKELNKEHVPLFDLELRILPEVKISHVPLRETKSL